MEDIEDLLLPEINLETDDIIMNIIVKKDYSEIEDINERKKEFIKDLKAFIDEFSQTDESFEFMVYYDWSLELIISNTSLTSTLVS